MKKDLIKLGFLLIIVLLTSCPGAIDSLSRKDLGHGYVYHEVVNLPTISNEINHKGIPGVVMSYAYNKEFIVVLEKYKSISAKEKDELITNGKYYDLLSEKGDSKYWIIVHSIDSIYGPFNKEEYFNKRIELGVPLKLQLREE